MDQGEADLVADVVVAPDLGDDDLVVAREAPRDVERGHGHVEVEGHLQSAVGRPLRHGLEVVDGLDGLDLDDPLDPPALLGGVQDGVREDGGGSRADARVLLRAGVDPDLETALVTPG